MCSPSLCAATVSEERALLAPVKSGKATRLNHHLPAVAPAWSHALPTSCDFREESAERRPLLRTCQIREIPRSSCCSIRLNRTHPSLRGMSEPVIPTMQETGHNSGAYTRRGFFRHRLSRYDGQNSAKRACDGLCSADNADHRFTRP